MIPTRKGRSKRTSPKPMRRKAQLKHQQKRLNLKHQWKWEREVSDDSWQSIYLSGADERKANSLHTWDKKWNYPTFPIFLPPSGPLTAKVDTPTIYLVLARGFRFRWHHGNKELARRCLGSGKEVKMDRQEHIFEMAWPSNVICRQVPLSQRISIDFACFNVSTKPSQWM